MTSKTKKRLFSEEYVTFGFTFIIKEEEQLPQCVICHKVLSNDAMRPVRLQRHLKTVHPELQNKSRDFFLNKTAALKRMRLDSTAVFNVEAQKAMEASYEISLTIAKNKKPHTLGETVIKPCLLIAAAKMMDANAVRQFSKIPISNNTVKRRIDDMAEDIKEQLILQVKQSPFLALQCDETTDVSSGCQLLFYCRYIMENEICEELLFSKSLTSNSRGQDIFMALSEFLEANEIPWTKIVGVCTDGAPSMVGSRIGFKELVKQKNASVIFTHCVIHRQALAARTLPDEIQDVLQCAIDVVNTIKKSALRTRLFENLCMELKADHKTLLFHTEVRWLSKGNMLRRLYELKTEVEIYLLSSSNQALYDKFTDSKSFVLLAYLTDFFELLNNLNLKLQGENTNILTAIDSVNIFISKIFLWKERILNKPPNFVSFPRLSDVLDSEDIPTENFENLIVNHLDALGNEFKKYFPDTNTDSWQCKLISNPFIVDVMSLPETIQEEAIELKCDSCAKNDFESLRLQEFWLKYKEIYPNAATCSLKLLIQFSSTYLCEKSFSSLLNIKTKYRSCLDVDNDLRCALSKISPNIKKLVEQHKNCQNSH